MPVDTHRMEISCLIQPMKHQGRILSKIQAIEQSSTGARKDIGIRLSQLDFACVGILMVYQNILVFVW